MTRVVVPLAGLLFFAGCMAVTKGPDMPHGAAVAPPPGFVALCRRRPREPGCRLQWGR